MTRLTYPARTRVARAAVSRSQVHWVTTLAMTVASALAITVFALGHAVAQMAV